MQAVIGSYITALASVVTVAELSVQNAPKIHRTLLPLLAFAKQFPDFLQDEAEKLHNLIFSLEDAQSDSNYGGMMTALLKLAQITLPLSIKNKETIDKLQNKFAAIIRIQSQVVTEQAISCLAILTMKSGGESISFVHALAREFYSNFHFCFLFLLSFLFSTKV